MQEQIYITKEAGNKELYDREKLVNSLKISKATDDMAEKITDHIEGELKEGMSTREIYKHAFDLLKRESRPAAVSYSLRKAIMDLGPTGFPFERFIAEIFKYRGYKTETDVEIMGECVSHEIDVVAWNENELIVVEAKFHNELGTKSDVKVVLYIKARFDDTKDTVLEYGHRRKIDESWLVTNTKFSKQAIHYAECKGMKLIGWGYPAKGNLQNMLEDAGLHPVTCLTSLSGAEKRMLVQSGVVLCKSILDNPELAVEAGINKSKIDALLAEIKEIQG